MDQATNGVQFVSEDFVQRDASLLAQLELGNFQLQHSDNGS
jgi:hypothetical protein